MAETAEEKFTRIATRRVNKVLDDLRLLENLSSSAYKSTPLQREKIVSAIRDKLNQLEALFAGSKEDKNKSNFEL